MKRIAVVIALLCATSAGADALQEWRTPAGKIYFGDHPPEGSVAVKKVQKPLGKVAVPNPPRPGRAEPQSYAWRNDVGCQELTFTGVKEEPFDGINRRILRGSVTHNGNHVVKNVKVCGPGLCDELRAGEPMRNGEKEDFYLDVESADPVALRIECSIREPA
jgi:hypothetical protein